MDRPRIGTVIVFGFLALVCCASPKDAAFPEETVDLRPASTDSSTALALLPASWTRPRIIEVSTSPPGAALELFYLRRNVQQRFERARAPVRVAIPPRVETSRRDAVLVRATLDGYRVTEAVLEPGPEQHTITLEALPNRLERFAYRELSGRATLLFATREALRFQVHDEARGFRVLLPETSLGADARTTFVGIESEIVEGMETLRIGDDLLVRVTLGGDERAQEFGLRGRRWRDPAQGSSGFAIDIGPPAGDAQRAKRLREALDGVSPADVSGCALSWESSIRGGLDASELARALGVSARDGDDAFRHAAMRRLGELSKNGVVRSRNGTEYRVEAEVESFAASSVAPEIIGYIALLRSAAVTLTSSTHRHEVLRGLLAPELATADWKAREHEADRTEQACLARASAE